MDKIKIFKKTLPVLIIDTRFIIKYQTPNMHIIKKIYKSKSW